MSSKEYLIKGCLDVAKSGGLSGVLWISTLPNTPLSLLESTTVSFDDCMDCFAGRILPIACQYISSGKRNDVATAANQVLLSLGFTEDEITVQVARNNPQLLADSWFCLQCAAVLLQKAMARAECKAKVLDLWQLPFSKIDMAKLEERLADTHSPNSITARNRFFKYSKLQIS
jgi:hypothetical protein